MLGIVPLLQEFGLSHLTLLGVSPDAITIFLAFIALIAGQRSSMSFGFAIGIIMGILSGNMGLNMLVRTIEGFVAGYFHIPDSSHSTTKQKTRHIYGAVVTAGFCGNAIFAIGYNPLALSPLYRIVVLGVLESLFTLILAVILNWLFLRKSLAD